MPELKIDHANIEKPPTEYEVGNVEEITIAQKKADTLLLNLERLKADLATTKAKYKILQTDYADICDNAISRIITLRHQLSKQSPEKTGDSTINRPSMSNLSARIELGLVPPEINVEHTNNSNEKANLKLSWWQFIVDKVGTGIEFMLDKIGDGIILFFRIIFRIKKL